MRSKILSIIFFILAVSFVSSVCAQQMLYVQVREAKLRSSPAAWSTSVTSLAYGDPLLVVGGEDPWWEVKARGRKGYIAASSVSDRKIVLSSVNHRGNAMVDQSDVVLAGKGFSKEVEKSFAASSGLNFKKVDQVEKSKVLDSDLRSFMRAGDLKGAN